MNNGKMLSKMIALAATKHEGQFDKGGMPYILHPRALCVCSAGMLRSATMAWVLSNSPFDFNTRACGTEEFALVRLDMVLYKWSDYVLFAHKQHQDFAFKKFGKRDNTFVVGLEDKYNYRDPELLRVLDVKFDNLLGHLFGR